MSLKTPKSIILDYLVSLAKCISVYRIDTLLSRQTKLIIVCHTAIVHVQKNLRAYRLKEIIYGITLENWLIDSYQLGYVNWMQLQAIKLFRRSTSSYTFDSIVRLRTLKCKWIYDDTCFGFCWKPPTGRVNSSKKIATIIVVSGASPH